MLQFSVHLMVCAEIVAPKFFVVVVVVSACRMPSCFWQALGGCGCEAHGEGSPSKPIVADKTISTGCFGAIVGGGGYRDE